MNAIFASARTALPLRKPKRQFHMQNTKCFGLFGWRAEI
jgi:hypothetical protein